jgi:energy-coupling factor transport system ATP-binding protein
MSVIELKDVSFVYQQGMPDAKTAVSGVSLSIEAGEFIGIIGHTGSGKSTLIQMLNGLLKPTTGSVYVKGSDIWKDKASLRQSRFDVGLVLQYPEYQLFAETVYEDIAFGPRNMGLDKEEVDRRVLEAAGYLAITEDMLKRSPFDLSGGEKRRAAIAGVLAMKPDILVLDEPTAGLDPRSKRQLMSFIDGYHRKEGNTVLFVSHSMDDVARYSDRVLVLRSGGIYAFEGVKEIFMKVEELKEIGLDVPAVTDILLGLKALGHGLDTSLYTPQEAAEEILRAKREME